MRVIPYNRCVTDLGGRSPSEFLRLVSGVFHIEDHNTGNIIRGNSCSSSSSKYEQKSQNVGTADYLSGEESILSTEASLSVWPVRGARFMLPTCESLKKNRDNFDCLKITPCSSTDSDSQDSFDQYDLERSERHIDNESLTYLTSRLQRDCLDSLPLKGVKRNMSSDAYAPAEQESTANQTSTALERVYREGTVSESKCRGGDLHTHLIMMYLEGRWLDLRPRDAVEEDDRDPLSSLDIQVFSLFLSFLYSLHILCLLLLCSLLFICIRCRCNFACAIRHNNYILSNRDTDDFLISCKLDIVRAIAAPSPWH